MWQLQLPTYSFRTKKIENGFQIFDEHRRRYVKLTPEEWVRQNFLRFLLNEKHYPKELLSVECQLEINGMKKRCDAVFHDLQGKANIIIEFKAPNIAITQDVFDQAAVYNSQLNVDFLFISNGLDHFACYVNKDTNSYDFFETIPEYKEILDF